MDIAASGATFNAMTAALSFLSGFQGHVGVANRASDVQGTPPSRPQAAKVVGYGSIICDEPGYLTLGVALCKRRPLGDWALRH
ncbi:hypothetical protein ACQEU6_29945 [Spirillospora sp. CA-108201]